MTEYAMLNVETGGRVIVNAAGREHLLSASKHWVTEYRVENTGEAMTCEHGHPACGIGSTLCGDEHQ